MLEKTNKKETPLRANEQTIISRCLIWSLCSNSTNLAVFVWLSQWTRLVLILEQERQGLFQGLIPVPFNKHSKSQDSANSFSLCWGHYLSMFLKKNKFSSSGSKGHTASGFWKKNDLEGNTILIMPGPEPILLSFCTLVARFYIILYTCKLQQKLPWLSSLLQVGKHYICPARETSPP